MKLSWIDGEDYRGYKCPIPIDAETGEKVEYVREVKVEYDFEGTPVMTVTVVCPKRRLAE